MKNFSYIVIGLYVISILLFTFVALVESYCKNKPETKFSKWWRKNIVGEYEEN